MIERSARLICHVFENKGFTADKKAFIIFGFSQFSSCQQVVVFDGHVALFLFVAMDFNELVTNTIEGLGFDLVDIEQSPRGRILRIFIDKPEKPGGIDVEDCAYVSNHLSRVLAVENIDYDRLEISSPGLDRVLKKPADFARFSGADVNIRLRMPLPGGRRNLNGVLHGIENDQVSLVIDTGEITLSLSNIEKARLVPKFDKP